MKKSIIVLIAIFCVLSVNAQSDFSRGYDIGYGEGYCYDKGIGCIKPISPIPPIPKIEESLDNYQDGHKRGFTDGLAKQKSESQNQQGSNDRKRYETTESKFVDDFIYQPNYDLILKVLELKEQQAKSLNNNDLNNKSSTNEIIINLSEFAIINIYRPKKTMGSLLPIDVLINGQLVAKLYSGGHLEYKIYDLTPKSITIKSAGISNLNISPSKNNVYYFETNPKFNGFTLKQISNPVPDKELKEKRYISKADYIF